MDKHFKCLSEKKHVILEYIWYKVIQIFFCIPCLLQVNNIMVYFADIIDLL